MGDGAATIASARAAICIGSIFSSLFHSVPRDPSMAKEESGYANNGFDFHSTGKLNNSSKGDCTDLHGLPIIAKM